VADDRRPEHAVAAGDDAFGELAGQHGAPVLVAEDELVEPGEQEDTPRTATAGVEQVGSLRP
jgi:hypothetical protein